MKNLFQAECGWEGHLVDLENLDSGLIDAELVPWGPVSSSVELQPMDSDVVGLSGRKKEKNSDAPFVNALLVFELLLIHRLWPNNQNRLLKETTVDF